MASLTIPNLDETLKNTLRMSAAANKRSMEDEALLILRRFLLNKKEKSAIGSRITERFAAAGGVDLPPVQRSLPRLCPLDVTDDGL